MRLPDAVQDALGVEAPKAPPPLQVVCIHCAKVTDRPVPKTGPAQGEVLAHLMRLRDDMVRSVSHGKFADAAAMEWKGIPVSWRADLLLLAGLGADMEALELMSRRDWYELPPPDRALVSGVIRSAKRHLCGLTALAARV